MRCWCPAPFSAMEQERLEQGLAKAVTWLLEHILRGTVPVGDGADVSPEDLMARALWVNQCWSHRPRTPHPWLPAPASLCAACRTGAVPGSAAPFHDPSPVPPAQAGGNLPVESDGSDFHTVQTVSSLLRNHSKHQLLGISSLLQQVSGLRS